MTFDINKKTLTVRKYDSDIMLSGYDLCIFLSEVENQPNCFKYSGIILVNVGIILNLPPTESTSNYFVIYSSTNYDDLKRVQNLIDDEVRKQNGKDLIFCDGRKF